ncbi:ABC transporter permease [Pseudonocardia nematodicida]|uniref:ABC transporter permease n=1 Tax=Pseudonocardia nematodicida TaxID=1206997 RepID=A0ABV1KHR2_9PSEU
MSPLDLLRRATVGAVRARARTALTVIAIVVGAFTLTITNGLGTGINRYISDTVDSLGASGVATVTRAVDDAPADGPTAWDPERLEAGPGFGPGGGMSEVEPITDDDLTTLAEVEGVTRVAPVVDLPVDYVRRGEGTAYELSFGSAVPGARLQLEAGSQPDDAVVAPQMVLPAEYLEPLGFAGAEDAVGAPVTLAVTDAAGTRHETGAVVTGISGTGLGPNTSASANEALTTELDGLARTGLPAGEEPRYAQATVWFDPSMSEQDLSALTERLADAGWTATTVEDLLGTFTTVIDGLVLVLNGFAVIALLAAGFGIVNTLLMSVQERTREIGLMKAMGLGSGRVFALFSTEAVVIGLMGSAIGTGLGVLAGTVLSDVLARGPLADLTGLTVIAFDPVALAAATLLVVGIAFVAGALPATRAARKDPIDALRHE